MYYRLTNLLSMLYSTYVLFTNYYLLFTFIIYYTTPSKLLLPLRIFSTCALISPPEAVHKRGPDLQIYVPIIGLPLMLHLDILRHLPYNIATHSILSQNIPYYLKLKLKYLVRSTENSVYTYSILISCAVRSTM